MHLDPWTLVLQAANFLVLLWLLHRFLYRPVLKVIDARQDAQRKQSAELEARSTAAAALQADLQAQRTALDASREEALRAARAAAETERKDILAKAQTEADALKAKARTAFEQERADVVQGLGRDAARLAAAIVRRLLQQAPAGALQAASIERICADIQAMPEDARRRIGERIVSSRTPPVVVTASPLDKPAKARLTQALSAVLAKPAAPAFEVDSSLLAGVEVRFPFTILRRTWADELSRIETELVHDDGASKLA